MKITDLTVSDIGVRLLTSQNIHISANCEPFVEKRESFEFIICFEPVERIPALIGEEVFRNYSFSVVRAEGQFWRCFHDFSLSGEVYAVASYEAEQQRVTVKYRPNSHNSFNDCLNCLSCSCLEEILLSRDRMVLHASLIDTTYGGILFSGPSGIGKSTQANLWQQYEGSTVINGDRPIVGRTSDGWMAYGSPYAGSSGYYVNKSVPITAIFMLEQSNQCTLRRLKGVEAFGKLYSGMVINSWNPAFVNKVCDLINNLVMEIPVYHFSCTADQNAVKAVMALLDQGVN